MSPECAIGTTLENATLTTADPPLAPDGPRWSLGWYAGARHCVSPNCGVRPAGAVLDLVLLHSISLPPGVYEGDAVERLFTNTLDWDAHPYFQSIRGLEVSAHFFIRRDGALWQFVSCEHRAWHAGASSFQGRDNCNDFSIGVELEGLEGQTFEPAQYARLRALLIALAEQYPARHLAGHSDVAPGRKCDPGPGFEWHRLVDVASKLKLALPTS